MVHALLPILFCLPDSIIINGRVSQDPTLGQKVDKCSRLLRKLIFLLFVKRLAAVVFVVCLVLNCIVYNLVVKWMTN